MRLFDFVKPEFGGSFSPDKIVAIRYVKGERFHVSVGKKRECKIRKKGSRYFFKLLVWNKPTRVKFHTPQRNSWEPAKVVFYLASSEDFPRYSVTCETNDVAKEYRDLAEMCWQACLDTK